MDRNDAADGRFTNTQRSLSARRAWIEIFYRPVKPAPPRVALRKESVDRNLAPVLVQSMSSTSLSARRAWIEIVISGFRCGGGLVALRKESVDRNQQRI